jgi:hypothetical protein
MILDDMLKQEKERPHMTPRPIALLLLVCVASTAFAQSRVNQKVPAAAAAPASRPAASVFSGLARGTTSFSAELERSVFNPQGLRAPLSQRLSSLDRELEPGEGVVILEPLGYLSGPEGVVPLQPGIEYLWEVLTSDQGVLVAVPVPILESFGRAANVCDCTTSKPEGRCSAQNFCFQILPLEEHCLKKIDMDTVPDVDLLKGICLPKQKGAVAIQPQVDFVVSYPVRHQGREGWIALWGRSTAQAVHNAVWGGGLVAGVGYFLDGPQDAAAVPGAPAAATAFVSRVVGAQGLASQFEFGIKEKGIK